MTDRKKASYEGRKGPRPHLWHIKDATDRDIYYAFLVARAQAKHRGELFELTYEQYRDAWTPYWHLRGRKNSDYVLTRLDPSDSWSANNIECMERKEHLKRQTLFRECKGA